MQEASDAHSKTADSDTVCKFENLSLLFLNIKIFRANFLVFSAPNKRKIFLEIKFSKVIVWPRFEISGREAGSILFKNKIEDSF